VNQSPVDLIFSYFKLEPPTNDDNEFLSPSDIHRMQTSLSDMFRDAKPPPSGVDDVIETRSCSQSPSAKKQRLEDDVDSSSLEDLSETRLKISLDEYKDRVAVGGASVGPNAGTGPGSIWLYAKRDSSYDSQSLNSPSFDPSKPLAGYTMPAKVDAPLPYGLIGHALELIEALKASGSGSRKKTIVVLGNLFRLIIFRSPAELLNAIYLIINKLAPDYENLELGVGDQIVMRAMADA